MSVSVESRIEQVTVYASGARVRRVASLRAPVAASVRIVGLPLSVIDDTVRAEVDGGTVVVTALRLGVDAPASDDTRSEESAELRTARRRVALAETETERLRVALKRLASASVIETDPTDEPPAAWQTIVTARRTLVALRAERELGLRDALAKARRELADAQRALEVAAETDQRAGSARAARLHELRKYVELDITGTGDAHVHLEYQVAAARWAPSYVAKLDGEQARVEMRAVVAQDSGEDWNGVALRLSTAEPEQFAQLPELHPQKIGRRQAEPARRGFRAPPIGADALYDDYDRSFPACVAVTIVNTFDDSTYEGRAPEPPPPPPPPRQAPLAPFAAELTGEVWDEESSRAKQMYPGDVPEIIAPASARKGGGIAGAVAGIVAAPFALAAQAVTRSSSTPVAPGAPPALRQEPAAPPRVTDRAGPGYDPAPAARLDYGNLRMAPPSASDRGKLVAAGSTADAEIAMHVAEAMAMIEELVLPPGHTDDWLHTYDYAFASDGTVEVRSDAAWHSLALTSRAAAVETRHVAVPREQADVFRIAGLTNPFAGPLLPGPIDVYDRGQFLVTSEVDYTPPGGTVDIGLGVDPTVKIARNVEFHEEAAGMLRGALKLIHAVSIEIENLSPRSIELEVRERVPVTREGDDDIEVNLGKVDPQWERWTPDPEAPRAARLRGGYRWKVALAAKAKQLLRAGYEVKIAGKLEIVGGNRREP